MMIKSLKKEKRLIHIYTGDGKGKTTTALGLVVRACGQGWRVCMVQFMKGREGCGEENLCASIPNFKLVRCGLPSPVCRLTPSSADRELAQNALRKAKEAIFSGQWDMVVLDEVNVALDFGLIPLGEVASLLQDKPKSVELVLTGRRAHPDLIALADYVSEISEIKHPFRNRVRARKGVEF